jgi:tellurite resistance protein TerC
LPISGWIIFNAGVVVILFLELFVFHKKAHVVSFKEALISSIFSFCLAGIFNCVVYFLMGEEAALNFLTGYLIEKSLSVDNLFVFLFIFSYFRTPEFLLHKALFWGIIGAIVTRAFFILVGVALVQKFHIIVYVFGLFLLFTGIKLIFKKEKKIKPEKNIFLKICRHFIPVTKDYEGESFFVRKGGQLFATPLWIVLLSIETADLIFAIDSIPAILSITYDPFIAYSSNIFAILGLRALFFLVAGSLKSFKSLHYGISIILVFVGFKMLAGDYLKISPFIALSVVIAILLCSILISVLFKKKNV